MLKKMAFSKDDPLLKMKVSELGSQLGALQRELKDTDRSLLIILSDGKQQARGRFSTIWYENWTHATIT